LHACWPSIRTGLLPFGEDWLAVSHGGGGISSGMTVSAAAAWHGPAQQVFGIGHHGMGSWNWGRRPCWPYGGVCV